MLYSHLSCLVRLNWTQVCSLMVRIFWAGVNTASHSVADQNNRTRPSWRGGLGPLPNQLWYGWMDEPMHDLSTRVVLFTTSGGTCNKASMTVNHTKKKNNRHCIWSDQSKWTSDFPGVNTPYNQVKSSFKCLALHVWTSQASQDHSAT